MPDRSGRLPDPRVGLCADCAFARRVVSGRGEIYWMCGLAARDRRFRKYPPLPVVECPGYESKSEG